MRGKPDETTARAADVLDHPRACGENYLSTGARKEHCGSPPRMRGKLRSECGAVVSGRITPAHAGKTSSGSATSSPPEDHPRACGENRAVACVIFSTSGSPPRMRGKRCPLRCPGSLCRITPAHAGKTLRKWRISVVDPSPQPQSSLTSRKADASIGSQRAPCAAPV